MSLFQTYLEGSPQFFDAHTHQTGPHKITNIFLGDKPTTNWFSVGIHPWHVAEYANTPKNKIKALFTPYLQNPNCIAIGECGYDFSVGPKTSLQTSILNLQLELAEAFQLPIIAHVVKAHQEFLEHTLPYASKVPIIIHGFTKHPQLAQTFLQKGYYLSFGKALLKNKNAQQSFVLAYQAKKALLETDDSELNIQDIYRCAAELIEQKSEFLRAEIFQHLHQIFSPQRN